MTIGTPEAVEAVGHGGGSGYLAAMALFGLAPDVMKPTALVLNLVVASVGTIRFARAGHFSWNIFWPFAVLSMGKLGGNELNYSSDIDLLFLYRDVADGQACRELAGCGR